MNEPKRPDWMTDELEAEFFEAALRYDICACRRIIEAAGDVWRADEWPKICTCPLHRQTIPESLRCGPMP